MLNAKKIEFKKWRDQFDADLDQLEEIYLEVEFETRPLYQNHHWLDMLRVRKILKNNKVNKNDQ